MEEITTLDISAKEETCMKPLPPGKQYHVFLSYRDVEGDREWVEDLINKLEIDYNLKCCNHINDFQPGRKIADNIKEAVLGSMKTLIILSNKYIDSYWCNYEVDFTHQLSMEMREQLIIPVLKEDCEIPDHLKPFTYVDAREPMDCWIKRLAAAIESPSKGHWKGSSQYEIIQKHTNLQTVYEIRSTLLPCAKTFKNSRYIPDAFCNSVFHMDINLYREILREIAMQLVIRFRCLALPFIPIVLIELFAILLATGSWLQCIKDCQGNITTDRNTECYFHGTGCIALNTLSSIVGLIPPAMWIYLGFMRHRLLRPGVRNTHKRLIDHNLLVGIHQNIFTAKVNLVFLYFNWQPCIEHIESIFARNVNSVEDDELLNDDIRQVHCDKNDNNDNDTELLMPSDGEEISQSQQKAIDMLVDYSFDYIQDFLKERLKEESPKRHSSKAECLCQYAESKAKKRYINGSRKPDNCII